MRFRSLINRDELLSKHSQPLFTMFDLKSFRNFISHSIKNFQLNFPYQKRQTTANQKGYSRQRHQADVWYPPSRRPVSEQCHWKYLSLLQLSTHSKFRENLTLATRPWWAAKQGNTNPMTQDEGCVGHKEWIHVQKWKSWRILLKATVKGKI